MVAMTGVQRKALAVARRKAGIQAGVVPRGRPPIFKESMTAPERARRSRTNREKAALLHLIQESDSEEEYMDLLEEMLENKSNINQEPVGGNDSLERIYGRNILSDKIPKSIYGAKKRALSKDFNAPVGIGQKRYFLKKALASHSYYEIMGYDKELETPEWFDRLYNREAMTVHKRKANHRKGI